MRIKNQDKRFSLKTVVCTLALGLMLSGCASSQTVGHDAPAGAADTTVAAKTNRPVHIPDPLEPWNRGVTKFNTAVDIVILDPLAMGYNAVVPDFMKVGIGNFLRNLRSPLYIANNLLQGDIGGAGIGLARFVMNTTVGLAGFIDVAAKQGLNHEAEDFGQTLAVWGIGDGLYLVWPILGPSTLRDTAGIAVDAYADPVRIVAFDEGEDWIYYTRGGIEALHNKAEVVDVLRDLRANSLDYYSALKSIYEQRRIALIRDHSYTTGKAAGTGYSSNGYDAYIDEDLNYQ